MIVNIYHCDGPDCSRHTRDPQDWFFVTWRHPEESGKFHFCRSECLLQGMAKRTEPTIEVR